MNVLDLLRRRRADRQADASTRYWRSIAMVASGDVKNDRAAAEIAGELEDLAPQLGFQTGDVEQHVAALRELRGLDVAPARLEELMAEQRLITDQQEALSREHARVLEEHRARGEDLATQRSRLIGQFGVLDRARQRHAELLAQLTGVGMPEDLSQKED